MEFYEFGDIQKPKLLLIHGMAITWQYCLDSVIKDLSKEFYLIIPELDGHNVKGSTNFQSLGEETQRIEQYVLTKYGHSIHGAYGFSMGGTILINIISNQNILMKNAILDSAYCTPLGIYAKGVAKWLTNLLMAIKNEEPIHPSIHKVLASYKIDVQSLKRAIFINASSETIYNCFLDLFHYTIPQNISSSTAEVTYWFGSNEPFPPRSLKYLKEYLPNVKVKVFDNMGHGELITKHPKRCIEEMKRVFLD